MKWFTQLTNYAKSYWCKTRGVATRDDDRRTLEQWFEQPFGKRLLQQEQVQLNDTLPEMFGFHLLQMSAIPGGLSTVSSTINHRFIFTPEKEYRTSTVSEFEALPLPSDTVDVCILHHALEFSPQPHQLLREAARVTIPHGYMVVFLYNPWSLWGWLKHIRRLCFGKADSCYHDLHRHRVEDWLRLLDFTPVSITRIAYQPPIQSVNWLERFSAIGYFMQRYQVFGGAAKVLVARKEVSVGSPLHSRWAVLRPKMGFGVAKPTSFVHNPPSTKKHIPKKGC
ncbi:MAG: class I SAM-dependent methyltransferase [Cellvibrionaceae bacterium]